MIPNQNRYNLYAYYSFDYLIKLAGDRTVPIELGSRYSDDDWTQKLMTITDFVKQYCQYRVCTSVFISESKYYFRKEGASRSCRL
jgi:hypothetical protein